MRAFLVMLSLAFMASVQTQAITVEEIVANNIEARGGATNISNLRTMKASGTMQTMGGEMQFLMLFKGNQKMKMEMEIQGQKIVQAFDGITAWMINPMMGSGSAQKLPKDQGAQFAERADLEGDFVNYAEKGIKLEYAGAEDIDGMTAYKVNVTKPTGETSVVYVDAITWFIVREDRNQEMMGQEMVMEIVYSNFKDVGGVNIPMQISMTAGGNEFMSMTWTTAEVNVAIDDKEFEFPG